METHKAKSELDACETAGESINEFLRDNARLPILFLMSGGSALGILDFIDDTLLNENLTVSVLDERFTQNLEDNNFAQIEKTSFFTLAVNAEVNFIGTLPRPNDTLLTMTERFERALLTWTTENPNGKVVAVLGMGTDGHTAGIFPNADKKDFIEKFHSKKWVIGYDNNGQKLPRQRITTTLTFFEKIDLGIIFVCGESKKAILEKIIKNDGKENLVPALGWQHIKAIKLITDI